MKLLTICIVLLAAATGTFADPAAAPAMPDQSTTTTQVGGANAPQPSRPPKLAVKTTELQVGKAKVRVPVGEYEWPDGAPAYSVPGPIVAFQGADGVWRGHSYLETMPRVVKMTVTEAGWTAPIFNYSFDDGSSYIVHLEPTETGLVLKEQSDLGPRNLWVFDAYYNWQPAAGFAIDREIQNHAFVYLPCHYDKPEVVIKPAGEDEAHPPMGVAVVSDDPAKTDVAGFHVRQLDEGMNVTLWQRRQLPGRPASRHFLGPETKSDATPNPRTAPLLGESLYEGHVTLEFGLGEGERTMIFAVTDKGEQRDDIPANFKRAVPAE